MYSIDWNNVQPRPELLAQCHRVDVDGYKHSAGEMRRWARKNTNSLIWIEILDMSDISSWSGPDNLVTFYFGNEQDALLFQLRWS